MWTPAEKWRITMLTPAHYNPDASQKMAHYNVDAGQKVAHYNVDAGQKTAQNLEENCNSQAILKVKE